MRALYGPSLALGMVCLLLSCGGGGGGGEPATTTLRLLADPDFDGVAFSSGSVFFSPSASFHCTGDWDASLSSGVTSRQIYAFHIGGLDAGRIVHATLRLHQRRVDGNPYGKWGDVVVDHVDYVDDPGADTYDGQSLSRRFAVLSTGPDLGARTVDVTEELIHDLEALSLYSQYRIRFWNALPGFHDDHDDFAQFAYAEVPAADEVPRLIVEYR